MNNTPRTNTESAKQFAMSGKHAVSTKFAERLELENIILRNALEAIAAGAPTEAPKFELQDSIRAERWEHWYSADYAREAFAEIENLK